MLNHHFMSYLQLLKEHPRTLTFSAASNFFSLYGQSHFLALYSLFIMQKLNLSNTSYGTLYSAATLIGAAALPLVGPVIDKIDVRKYSFVVGCGLVAGLITLLLAQSWLVMLLALFLLRLCGQGLCSHIGGVTTARYFTKTRGKALSLVSTGFPLAEGLFTPLIAFLIGVYSYEWSIYLLIGVLIFAYFPLTQFITLGFDRFNKPQQLEVNTPQEQPTSHQRSWTTKEVLKDPFFYLVIPHSLCPAFSLTGFLLYQAYFSEMKGWDTNALALALSSFAMGRFIFSFISGPLVDRYGAFKLFPFYQIPLTLGFALFFWADHNLVAYASMVLFGVTVGVSSPIKSSIWPEVYGVKHLGAIKSLFGTVVVSATALSSLLFGLIIDASYGTMIAQGLILLSLTTTALALIAQKLYSRRMNY